MLKQFRDIPSSDAFNVLGSVHLWYIGAVNGINTGGSFRLPSMMVGITYDCVISAPKWDNQLG